MYINTLIKFLIIKAVEFCYKYYYIDIYIIYLPQV